MINPITTKLSDNISTRYAGRMKKVDDNIPYQDGHNILSPWDTRPIISSTIHTDTMLNLKVTK